jgi:hypothetical protein
MSQNFQPGDFLIFQLESGFGLLRVLDVEKRNGDTVWHLAAYRDFFLDTDMADAALENPALLAVSHRHLALTNRAFESTQVARMTNVPLNEDELAAYKEWNGEISDRSVRLMMGLR